MDAPRHRGSSHIPITRGPGNDPIERGRGANDPIDPQYDDRLHDRGRGANDPIDPQYDDRLHDRGRGANDPIDPQYDDRLHDRGRGANDPIDPQYDDGAGGGGTLAMSPGTRPPSNPVPRPPSNPVPRPPSNPVPRPPSNPVPRPPSNPVPRPLPGVYVDRPAPGRALQGNELVGIVRRAIESGLSCEALAQALRQDPATERAGKILEQATAPGPDGRPQLTLRELKPLREALGTAPLSPPIVQAAEKLSFTIERSPTGDLFCLTWGEPAVQKREDGVEEVGSIVAIDVDGLQAGEGNRQVNVFVFQVKAPSVDLDRVFTDARVREATDALATNPRDEVRRADLHAAMLSVQPDGSVESWTNSLETGGEVRRERGGGAQAVTAIRSRNMQIGNHSRQHNVITTTVSPTLDGATFLSANPAAVRALVDWVGSGSAGRFDVALKTGLRNELAATDLSAGRGLVLDAPHAGETLHLDHIQGATVGKGTQLNREEVKVDRPRRCQRWS